MKSISAYFIEKNISKTIFQEPCHHFFSVGFEERCIAYSKIINEYKVPNNHTYYCTYSPAENVSDHLKTLTEQYKNQIQRLVPSVQFKSFSEIEQIFTNVNLSKNIFIDVSSLPRVLIFKMLISIIKNQKEMSGIHFIYTFPKEYDYEELQLPHSEIDLVFNDGPKPAKNKKAFLFIIPGFDRTYVDKAFDYLKYNSEPPLKHSWIIPFPGRKYIFYERVIESHLIDLKDDKFHLLPQEEIILSYKELKRAIEAELDGTRDIFILPVGCRINCLPVLLATIETRKNTEKTNIIIPRTKWYNSSRSSGFEEPLIELIPEQILAKLK